MSFSLFWQGIIVGLSIAAPIGPMCIFCLRKSINEGILVGLTIALGVSLGDAVYALIASQGIAALSLFLNQHAAPLKLLGALVIAYLGYSALTTTPTEGAATCHTTTLWRTFFSSIGLTLASPMTIALFMAFFTRFEAAAFADWRGVLAVVTGITTGSLIWFTGLTTIVHLFRGWFTPKRLYYINIVSGIILLGFSAATIISIFN